MTPVHEPVMVAEVLRLLEPGRGGLFVDCTVGFAGHTRALLEAGADRVLGFDRDPEALARAAESLAPFHDRVELIHADFRELAARLDQRGIAAIDGLLADLGVSSWQLDAPERGFSFRADGPLDMRMDTSQGATAADLLRDVREEELADLIYGYGEERFSRRIARAHRRSQAHGADRHHGPPCGDRAARGAEARVSADRSGDAHVSGAAHLGQPRAGRTRHLRPRRHTAFAHAAGKSRGGEEDARARAVDGWRSSRSTRSRIASSSTRCESWTANRACSPC